MSDPIERMVADALDKAGIAYVAETDPRACGLDFYLPNVGVHIEVKQFHSERIADQMSRADDVIVIQGRWAAEIFCGLIRNNDPKWAEAQR
jgi:hypothetical protein